MHLEESQVVADNEFFLQNVMPIERRFYQWLSLLLYHRKQSIFDKINAVANCRSEGSRYCGHNFLVRINIDRTKPRASFAFLQSAWQWQQ